jgi:hypothetical protein
MPADQIIRQVRNVGTAFGLRVEADICACALGIVFHAHCTIVAGRIRFLRERAGEKLIYPGRIERRKRAGPNNRQLSFLARTFVVLVNAVRHRGRPALLVFRSFSAINLNFAPVVD